MAAKNTNNIKNSKNTTAQSVKTVTDSNKGKHWTKSEEAQLDKEFHSGMSLEKMASIHKRTVLGIKYRIAKFLANRLLNEERTMRARHAVSYMTSHYQLPEDALKHWLVSMSSTEILTKMGILPDEYSDSDSDSDSEEVPKKNPQIVTTDKVVPIFPVEVATPPTIKQCAFMFTRGSLAGKQCEKIAVDGSNGCPGHLRLVRLQEKERAQEEPLMVTVLPSGERKVVAATKAPIQPKAEVINVETCKYSFNGMRCQLDPRPGLKFCKFHKPRQCQFWNVEVSGNEIQCRGTQCEGTRFCKLHIEVPVVAEKVIEKKQFITPKKDESVSSAAIVNEMNKETQPEKTVTALPVTRCKGMIPTGVRQDRCWYDAVVGEELCRPCLEDKKTREKVPAEYQCGGIIFGRDDIYCKHMVSRLGPGLCVSCLKTYGNNITDSKPVLHKLPPRDDNLASRLSSIEEKMEKFSEMVDRLVSKLK